MKTTRIGPFAFAALSAILLLAAVPAAAQVTCGATSYPKTCHVYEYYPQEVGSIGPNTISGGPTQKTTNFFPLR
jgi:hypothetical protein